MKPKPSVDVPDPPADHRRGFLRDLWPVVLLLILVLALALLFAPLPAQPGWQPIVRFSAAPDTVTVSFAAPADTVVAQVQYAAAQAEAAAVVWEGEGAAQTVAATAGDTQSDATGSRFTATLTGLSPGTSYLYRVGAGDIWSEPFAFTAAAPAQGQAGAQPLTFAYLGDSQSDPDDPRGYQPWAQLLEQLTADSPAFALIGGDLVNEESDSAEWNAFFAAGKKLFSTLPVMTIPGNHTSGAAYQALVGPTNGPAGYEKLFYSFDSGDAHIVALDSNYLGNTTEKVVSAIGDWLRADLAATQQTWKIVLMHHPLYPIYNKQKDLTRAEAMRQNYLPILENAGVDLILCGHQHVYCRTQPMKAGEISTHDQGGILQLMGNASAKAYAPNDHDYIAVALPDTPTYTLITLEGSHIQLTTKDSRGDVMDQYGWEAS